MGLDISHDGFQGAYSTFNRFRQEIAKAMDGSFPPHEDKIAYPNEKRWYAGLDFTRDKYPALYEFMEHSDCEGEISPETCSHLASELETLLPTLDQAGVAVGHLAKLGYGGTARKLIRACERAAAKDEPLKFM